MARTLVAASRHDGAFSRAWHVPSTSDLSIRQLTTRPAGTGAERHVAGGTATAGPNRSDHGDLKPAPLDDVLAETVESATTTVLHP
ncbi:hypothetical protein ABZ907_45585 [Nonomuraea wenchangensis]